MQYNAARPHGSVARGHGRAALRHLPAAAAVGERGLVAGVRARRDAGASTVLGRPKRCKLDHAFLWEYSYKRLNLAIELLGQLGGLLT